VLASQRERLLRAMLESVAERGYSATRVPDVVAAARVSRNAFYELFEDKDDCFLALADGMTDELLASLTEVAADDDWRTALDRGVRIYLNWWRENPSIARAYLLELPQAGERAVRQRQRQSDRFVTLFEGLAEWMRRSDPGLAPLNAVAARLLVVGTTEVVAREVRQGRLEHLDELHPELVDLACRMLG
jgi:AcrR family transcriptional regulator